MKIGRLYLNAGKNTSPWRSDRNHIHIARYDQPINFGWVYRVLIRFAGFYFNAALYYRRKTPGNKPW